MSLNETKWWGWGDLTKQYDLGRRPFFWPHLRERLDFSNERSLLPPAVEDIELPPGRLSESDLEKLQGIFPQEQIALSREEKLSHTYGKSYHDLVRIRRRIFPEVPDAVLYPKDEKEVLRVFIWAVENRAAVVPWGGGTSVTGGVEAISGAAHRGLVVLDLKRMDKILAIDRESMLADVEAGILGPNLEKQLQQRGLTLSHYPESFEFSTLGGWIAARAAGQQSTMYGKIEDMVESVRLLTPTGFLQTPHLPAAANGPDLARLVIGSEGILGIITQARVRLSPIPEKKFYTAVLFRSFKDGVQAMRRILQSGYKPATLRLSDAEETDFIFSLRERKASPVANTLQNLGLRWLKRRGFYPNKRAILILGLEGSVQNVKNEWRAVKRILRSFSVFPLKGSIGTDWYRHRFENPYLRDVLMDYGILVDTLETATEWVNVRNIYTKVLEAIGDTYKKLGIKGVVTAHLSHMYRTGSSLYFILLASPHSGRELDEWWAIKEAASDAIVSAGGAISHHHGIGLDHRPWLAREIGEEGLRVLRNLKQTVDPDGILNPGKLLPDS
ncbi:MAG: FAD-binding protein [Proteobacteria bacterium]|nr:FAD-binding protein [Pseudomonadota bacterium]